MWRVLIACHNGVIDCNFYFNISILMMSLSYVIFISSCKGCNFLKLHSQLIHTIKAGKIHSYFVVI